ncbi:methyltransferase domain-containing protein [Flavisphingomonas formosensis]|uniref:methyltransferase domain-containing protein n=1 Tax=Flavisphingomonas formosensis TaxID=861534 RepID=UPI0018E02A32|nr:methyltransferase domain-containing protein [Sphingomonas formosensis]
MSETEIFDRAARRLRRDRAAPDFAEQDFLRAQMIEGLLDRLSSVTRSFSLALDLGCFDGALGVELRARGVKVVSADAGFAFAKMAGGVQCDEDRLPFADGSFDLILSAGVLDSVNDLPGALTLIRRALKPDGLFLGAFVGAGSLPQLRAAMLAGDMVHGSAAPRIHPQIEVRAAGDLLARAGFALPVADSERLDIRYPGLLRLAADLRAAGATNILCGRSHVGLTRPQIGAALQAFAEAAEPDGKTRERIEILYLTGWSPAPSQPQPARRGSAVRSLAEALRKS